MAGSRASLGGPKYDMYGHRPLRRLGMDGGELFWTKPGLKNDKNLEFWNLDFYVSLGEGGRGLTASRGSAGHRSQAFSELAARARVPLMTAESMSVVLQCADALSLAPWRSPRCSGQAVFRGRARGPRRRSCELFPGQHGSLEAGSKFCAAAQNTAMLW